MKQTLIACAFTASVTALLSIGWIMGGCSNLSPKQSLNPAIGLANDNVKVVQKSIGDHANNIDKHADAIPVGITTGVSLSIQQAVKSHVDAIHQETGGLRVDSGKLDAANKELIVAAQKSAEQEKALKAGEDKIAKQDKEISDLQRANSSLVTRAMEFLIILAVLGIGCSIYLFFSGNKLAISLGAASLLILCLSVLIAQYAVWLAIGGGIVLLSGVGLVVYELYLHRKAVVELVQTGEGAKQVTPPDVRTATYGSQNVIGIADLVQSQSTRDIVKSVRSSDDVATAQSLTNPDPVTVTIPSSADSSSSSSSSSCSSSSTEPQVVQPITTIVSGSGNDSLPSSSQNDDLPPIGSDVHPVAYLPDFDLPPTPKHHFGDWNVEGTRLKIMKTYS